MANSTQILPKIHTNTIKAISNIATGIPIAVTNNTIIGIPVQRNTAIPRPKLFRNSVVDPVTFFTIAPVLTGVKKTRKRPARSNAVEQITVFLNFFKHFSF